MTGCTRRRVPAAWEPEREPGQGHEGAAWGPVLRTGQDFDKRCSRKENRSEFRAAENVQDREARDGDHAHHYFFCTEEN